MSYKELPPVEVLWEYFEFAPLTGNIYWKENRGGWIRAGQEAGSKRKDGYRYVRLDRTGYLTHRIVWKFVTGEDPGDLDVDHRHDYVDGVYKSNYWPNLRLGSHPQNAGNSKKSSNNTSGFKGVFFHKATRKWETKIRANTKTYHLGYFRTPEEAHEAYKKKATELNGEFARFE